MCHPFFIFNFTYCKSFRRKKTLSINLFKIVIVSRPTTLIRVFLMGSLGCPTKGGNRGRDLPASPKVWTLVQITDHILGIKVSLIDFRYILPNILPAACIFGYTILTYLKNVDGIKCLDSLFLPKCPLFWCCFVAPTRCGLSRLLLKLYGKPLG